MTGDQPTGAATMDDLKDPFMWKFLFLPVGAIILSVHAIVQSFELSWWADGLPILGFFMSIYALITTVVTRMMR